MKNGFSTLLLAVFAIAGCASAPEAPAPAPTPVAAPAPQPAAAPAPAPKPALAKVTTAAEALFDFDRAVIRPDARSKLDDLVGKTRGVNLEVIIAIGHADRIGSDTYNMKLSLRRADAAKAYLVSKAVPASRIYTEGKGNHQPVKDCKGALSKALISCLQPNRRVEVEAVGTR
jgi:OOP family OmpA-OmpF porin